MWGGRVGKLTNCELRVGCRALETRNLALAALPREEYLAVAERTTPGIKVALTIAGSDSCGGAGIQADLKTFSVMGVYGASALTTITAQNTQGVKDVLLLEPDLIDKQIAAVTGDIEVHATKTGLLGSDRIVETTARAIDRNNLMPLVVDPVMITKSGDSLLDESAVKVLCKKLLPLAAVVTPNRFEAARLLGQDGEIQDLHGATTAARQICQSYGAKACVVKGIKRDNGDAGTAVDLFYDGHDAHEITSDWRPTSNTHGAGSCFSAAITAALALGEPIEEAIQTAKTVISEAIRQATDLGHGHAPVNPLAYLKLKT